MLRKRLAIGIPMAVAFALVLWLDGRMAPWYPLWFLTAALVMGHASLEIVNLLAQTSARPSGNIVFGGIMAILVANWIPHITEALGPQPQGYDHFDPSAPIHALSWPLLTFVSVVMFAFVAQGAQFQRPGATMASISGSVLAVAYVGLLGSFLIQMRWFEGPNYNGLFPLAALVATAKGTDIGAYTIGRIAGRHKLWPLLSPNKTIEGALGGLAFGVATTLLVCVVAREVLHIPTLNWAAVVGYGVLVSTTAQLGDLMESMIKRDCARKDSSATIPGFGGVLDVIDSLLFAAPVAYGYWLCFAP